MFSDQSVDRCIVPAEVRERDDLFPDVGLRREVGDWVTGRSPIQVYSKILWTGNTSDGRRPAVTQKYTCIDRPGDGVDSRVDCGPGFVFSEPPG